MYIERHVVTIETDDQGAGVGYTPVVTGFIRAIRYVKDDYADGVDFTITTEESGQAVLVTSASNASETFQPRAATVGITNAAALYAAGGTAISDLIPVAAERVKIEVAQGGDTKSGTFHVYIG
jgi:hypothetical protein